MLNLISILIGVATLPFALFALLPFLGWANWLLLPVAVVGLAFGMLSRGTAGRNLNLLVLLVGIVRLSLGGGLF